MDVKMLEYTFLEPGFMNNVLDSKRTHSGPFSKKGWYKGNKFLTCVSYDEEVNQQIIVLKGGGYNGIDLGTQLSGNKTQNLRKRNIVWTTSAKVSAQSSKLAIALAQNFEMISLLSAKETKHICDACDNLKDVSIVRHGFQFVKCHKIQDLCHQDGLLSM